MSKPMTESPALFMAGSAAAEDSSFFCAPPAHDRHVSPALEPSPRKRDPPRRQSSRARSYIPQTVTGTPSPEEARRKILSAQVRSGARSNTTRWPASAPQRSI